MASAFDFVEVQQCRRLLGKIRRFQHIQRFEPNSVANQHLMLANKSRIEEDLRRNFALLMSTMGTDDAVHALNSCNRRDVEDDDVSDDDMQPEMSPEVGRNDVSSRSRNCQLTDNSGILPEEVYKGYVRNRLSEDDGFDGWLQKHVMAGTVTYTDNGHQQPSPPLQQTNHSFNCSSTNNNNGDVRHASSGGTSSECSVDNRFECSSYLASPTPPRAYHRESPSPSGYRVRTYAYERRGRSPHRRYRPPYQPMPFFSSTPSQEDDDSDEDEESSSPLFDDDDHSDEDDTSECEEECVVLGGGDIKLGKGDYLSILEETEGRLAYGGMAPTHFDAYDLASSVRKIRSPPEQPPLPSAFTPDSPVKRPRNLMTASECLLPPVPRSPLFKHDHSFNGPLTPTSSKAYAVDTSTPVKSHPSSSAQLGYSVNQYRQIRRARFSMRLLKGHCDTVTAVALHDDIAVSASADTTLRIWDLTNGTEWAGLRGHTDSVTGVAILTRRHVTHLPEAGPEAAILAVSVSLDCCLKVWSVLEGRQLSSYYTYNPLTCCAVLPSGFVVVGTGGGKVEVWDLSQSTAVSSQIGHEGSVVALRYAEGYVYSVCTEGRVILWLIEESGEMRVAQTISDWLPEGRRVKSLAATQKRVFIGLDGGTDITVINRITGQVQRLRNHVGSSQGGCTDAIHAQEDLLLAASTTPASNCGATSTPAINIRFLPGGTYAGTLFHTPDKQQNGGVNNNNNNDSVASNNNNVGTPVGTPTLQRSAVNNKNITGLIRGSGLRSSLRANNAGRIRCMAVGQTEAGTLRILAGCGDNLQLWDWEIEPSKGTHEVTYTTAMFNNDAMVPLTVGSSGDQSRASSQRGSSAGSQSASSSQDGDSQSESDNDDHGSYDNDGVNTKWCSIM